MRNALPVLASGAAAALLLYGILWAVQPRVAPSADPWLDGWLAAGLKAQPGIAEPNPARHLIFVDARELFARPDLSASTATRYLLQGVKVQVVRLPPGAALEEIEEGRHLEFRLKKKGGAAHVCRSGRNVLFVSVRVNTPVLGDLKVSEKFVGQVFDAFEETARRVP